MHKSELSKKILETIDKDNICPRSRYVFTVKNLLVWITGGVSLLLGAITFAVMLFVLMNHNWDIARYLEGTNIPSMVKALPYLWIVSTALFIIVADYAIRHTRHGYRYPLLIIVLGTIGASAVFGGVLYRFGFGHVFDTAVAGMIPSYASVIEQKKNLWLKPDQGFLIGSIAQFNEEEHTLLLSDARGDEWLVYTTYARSPHHGAVLEGASVKIVGIKMDQSTFDACAIHPLRFRGVPRRSALVVSKGAIEKERILMRPHASFQYSEAERKEALLRIYRCKQDPAYQFITTNSN